MSKDLLPEMLKIVLSIMSRRESAAFREPVDWKGLQVSWSDVSTIMGYLMKYIQLFDYPDIVKHPMDLGTIKKRLEAGVYETTEDVANDIRLVWTNCMLYNRDGSEV